MTDTPNPAATASDDDLGVADLIRESFNLIHGDTIAEEEEGRSVEALTESYQTYVEQHFATLAQDAQQSVQAMEDGVKAWAEETAQYQAQIKADAEAAASAKAGKGGAAKPSKGS